MCCYMIPNENKKLRRKMRKNGGKMTFWKTLHIEGNTSCVKRNYVWKKGIHDTGLTAREARVKDAWLDTVIERGFHVYRSKCLAEMSVSNDRHYRAMIEVECDINDFIGADINTAVFTKVTITPRAWKTYLARRREIFKDRAENGVPVSFASNVL